MESCAFITMFAALTHETFDELTPASIVVHFKPWAVYLCYILLACCKYLGLGYFMLPFSKSIRSSWEWSLRLTELVPLLMQGDPGP